MIQAAWRKVECPTCGAKVDSRCGRGGMIHVARIAAGKAKRKGRNVSGSRARR
jgi:hypothetical protein